MIKYNLMHLNTICGTILYDETSGRIAGYRDGKTGLSPFLGNADAEKIKKWWEMRAIPASRAALQNILRDAGCFNAGSYLAKNLALSMTDAYWICPVDARISYTDVKLSNFAAYHEGKVPYHNATSYDPNASLGGQMEKYWDLSSGKPVLVKESYRYYGQQSLNEVFATRLHELQGTDVPFVRYFASIQTDRSVLCKCEAFTSDKQEFVPAYEVLESRKARNDVSNYDSYINICAESGIEKDYIQKFMDYQTFTDFIISNTDEHLLNFGILRNPETMQILGPAPIFDSGNSMFHADDKQFAYTRAGVLQRKITSFYDREEQLLKKIHDKHVVRMDLLPDSKEVKEFFAGAGIPEWKADVISQNYAIKLQLAKEFQHGKTISFYKENQDEKRQIRETIIQPMSEQRFIMICGVPGSGKSEKAQELRDEILADGYQDIISSAFFRTNQLLGDSFHVIDTEDILAGLRRKTGYEKTVTVVSLNSIRDEIKEKYQYAYDDLAFLVAEAQVKTALLSGATVIYDAANINRSTREHFSAIARDAGVTNRELYVMNIPEKEQIQSTSEWQNAIRITFENNHPDFSEGWSVIRDCMAEPEQSQEEKNMDQHDDR